jgi:hypothetical protein
MRNSTHTISIQFLMMRGGLQTKNRIKSCEKVYRQAREPDGGRMRIDNLTPDRIKTRHTLVARHLAWHASISRRTFLRAGVGVSVVGGALGLGLLRPVSALAAPGIGNVLPIPSTLEPFPGIEIHVQAPPFTGEDTDPSTVWNFQGASGIAFIDTSVTRTNRKTGEQQVLPSSNHMTFM